MMKKHVIAFILSVLLLVSFSGFTYAYDDNLKAIENEVSATTINFLEESAYSCYYYENRNNERFTILSVFESNVDRIAEQMKSYPLFRGSLNSIPFDETNLNTGLVSVFIDNLTLFQDEVAYYGFLNSQSAITYKYFHPSYSVVDIKTDNCFATVDIYETLDFQYSICDDSSMIITHYYVSLMKLDERWLIIAVESDDLFYQMYKDSGFDLEAEIKGASLSEEIGIEFKQSTGIIDEQKNPSSLNYTLSSTDRVYNPQNAVNYALTYSTSSDDSQIVPSYKNTSFYWTSASCQLFASQCVWAGFGGSNSQTDINNRYVMDTTGSYQWWSTQDYYNNPIYNDEGSPLDQGWNSWISCSQFWTYVNGVKNSSTESGLVCDTNVVAYNSNDLVGTSGLTASDLIGAVLHVKGKVNNVETAYAHAVFINAATGTNRGNVWFTAYNKCYKNILLSTKFAQSTTNTKNGILVIVPRYFRSCNGAANNYLYADLQNVVVMGSSGVTKTLYGRAKSPNSNNIIMKVYTEGSNTPCYTFTAYYSTMLPGDYVAGNVLFNQVGDWRVVVTSGGLHSYTFIVRVV